MAYPQAAWERAMMVQEVVLKALSGETHWFRAAEILGMSPAYLRDIFLPRHNDTFSRPPRDPESAWVALGDVDLDQILCHQETRRVGEDNTVTLGNLVLQVSKQPGRRTCAGLEVTVRRHLDGRHSIWRGPQRLGLFDAEGRPVDAAAPVHGRKSRPRTSRLDRPTAAPQRPQALSMAL